MKRFVTMLAVAVAVAAMTASVAGAATGPAMWKTTTPIGTASNTGAISGNNSSTGAHTLTFTSAQLSCADAVFEVHAVTTTTLTFVPTWSGCTFKVNGTSLANGTAVSNCTWDISLANAVFNTATGAATGGTLSECYTDVSVPAIGCTIHVFAQTREGVSVQNIDVNGNVSLLAEPWGSRISINASGITFTTTGSCPGLTEHGNDGADAGTVTVHNLWASL
jgi:hypothetical protein